MLADVARPRRIEPGPGQESVWDYPRPPRVDPTDSHVVVEFAGRVIADTHRPVRVLETSQAPGFYLPAEDVDLSVLVPSARRSTCEWKGVASYFAVRVGGATNRRFPRTSQPGAATVCSIAPNRLSPSRPVTSMRTVSPKAM